MFKWVATFIFNRVVFLAAVMIVVNAYATPGSCTPQEDLVTRLEKPFVWIIDVARALK